ncbi:hypothetical protein E2C01_004380 [Portunus trituberculatus]|uniref:Uncharacterized protein n=1 Tax=Portunus trituberculatus TaxID=210409 RepID=A0A5B7CRH4_PORTR|nr:hypothetical protein [Portunus trituberculatus]
MSVTRVIHGCQEVSAASWVTGRDLDADTTTAPTAEPRPPVVRGRGALVEGHAESPGQTLRFSFGTCQVVDVSPSSKHPQRGAARCGSLLPCALRDSHAASRHVPSHISPESLAPGVTPGGRREGGRIALSTKLFPAISTTQSVDLPC